MTRTPSGVRKDQASMILPPRPAPIKGKLVNSLPSRPGRKETMTAARSSALCLVALLCPTLLAPAADEKPKSIGVGAKPIEGAEILIGDAQCVVLAVAALIASRQEAFIDPSLDRLPAAAKVLSQF